MHCNRLCALALCALSSLVLISLVLIAAPASSAPVTQISYDVTGGTFGGSLSNSTGPITGGTLSFTPNVTIATPGAGIGALFLSLTGPGGFVSMSGSASGYIASVGLYLFGYNLFLNSNGSTFGTYSYNTVLALAGSTGFVYASRYSLSTVTTTTLGMTTTITYSIPFLIASHYFTLGNEVRTIIPEPNTGALLGLGVLGLGAAAGGRRALRRRRER